MKHWARDYDKCQECGTTERPHRALGLCSACYYKQYSRKPREKQGSRYGEGYDDGARDVTLAIHAIIEPAGGSCWLRGGHIYLQMGGETAKKRV